MRLDESRDNKGRHIGMQSDRINVRSVNIGLVLLHHSLWHRLGWPNPNAVVAYRATLVAFGPSGSW